MAPADVEPDDFLDPLGHHLAAVLRRYNRTAGDATRLRLRMAVHHGDVRHDAHGVIGYASLHLFRMLEATAFKKALQTAETDLGVIVSD